MKAHISTQCGPIFLCGLSQREIPHVVIVSDVAGGMVGVVHESETSRMGMRNANYLLTQYTLLGKVRFLLGGGWVGASEGRVISKFFTNWGGSNLFYSQLGEGHSFFWQGKKYSMSLS